MKKHIDSFAHVAEIANPDDLNLEERVIRKTYTLTKKDLKHIESIKDKCLNHKIVLSDSHIIRLALDYLENLPESTLIEASLQVPKILTGRPKKK